MKTFGLVICLWAVVLALSGCGAVPSPTAAVSGLGFKQAPWQDGSTAQYQWQNDASGQQIGTSQYSFDLNVGVWTVTAKDQIAGLDQVAEVRIDAGTLAPLGDTKTITTSNSSVVVTTQYENGKLSISAVVNGKPQAASIDVPSNALDNDQLLMTLRALPFSDGLEAKYTVIVAQNALKVDTTLTVQAQETVTVPAGEFQCWRVEIAAGQTKQTAWYQVALPNELVQYDSGTARMVLAGE